MNITATYLDDMTRRCGTDGTGAVFQRFYSCQHGDHEHVVAISVLAAESFRGRGERTVDEMCETFAIEEAARIIAGEATT